MDEYNEKTRKQIRDYLSDDIEGVNIEIIDEPKKEVEKSFTDKINELLK